VGIGTTVFRVEEEAGSMRIDWTARGTSLGTQLRDKIEQHLGRLERFLQGDQGAHVVVTKEGEGPLERHAVEIILRHRLGSFTAKEESPDPAAAVRDVLRRFDSQARKAHDKLVERRRHVTSVVAESVEVP